MFDQEKHIEAALTRYWSSRRDAIADEMATVMARCESPIEKILAAYLIGTDLFGSRVRISSTAEATPTGPGVTTLIPQADIGPYRVDFLFNIGVLDQAGDTVLYALIVECDGHEWHERTKEQAQRDRARDRFLAERGYRVIRFTGSEIVRNPGACADEVMSHLEAFYLASIGLGHSPAVTLASASPSMSA